MVLSPHLVALLLVAQDTPEAPSDAPATTEEQLPPPTSPAPPPLAPAPAPLPTHEAGTVAPPREVEPPKATHANAELAGGLLVSAERVLPLVTHYEGSTFAEAETAIALTPGTAKLVPDIPRLAFDGSIRGFTLGAAFSGTVYAETDSSLERERLLERTLLVLIPRLGYAISIGRSFGLWPRLSVYATYDAKSFHGALHAVEGDVAGLWFPIPHVALTLSAGVAHTTAPLRENERAAQTRIGLDGGFLLAF